MRFYLDRVRGADTYKPRLRIRYAGQVCSILVPLVVNPDKWVAEFERVARNSYHGEKRLSASSVNAYLLSRTE